MKKKSGRGRKPKNDDARVNTIKANGGLPESRTILPEVVTIGEAMRRAVEALGDVTIDDSLAPQQLRELGESYEEVVRMQAAYDAKADAAKIAKKALESTEALLREKVRAFTHPAPLPLFDAGFVDAVDAMLAGGGEVVEDAELAEATL